MSKPTLCVDFDGVLHSYTSGWQGADVVGDDPVPGAMDWLYMMTRHFDVCVYSARSSQPGGIEAMRRALQRWTELEGTESSWLDRLRFPIEKPSAFLTIDDRAICFDGDFRKLHPERLQSFTPWHKASPASPASTERLWEVWLSPDKTTTVRAAKAIDTPCPRFYDAAGNLVASFGSVMGFRIKDEVSIVPVTATPEELERAGIDL